MSDNKKKISSEDVAIFNTYNYKFTKLNNSAEKILYRRLRSFDEIDSGDLVSKRQSALTWMQKIETLALESRYNKLYHQATKAEHSSSVDLTLQQDPEQNTIKLLHEIGWFYSGSFYGKGDDNLGDRVGYPNLSFTVTTRKLPPSSNYRAGGTPLYVYVASYGIVEGVEKNRSNSGSYELFLTMDECVDFILHELEFSHRETLYKKEMSKLFNDFLTSEKGRTPAASAIFDKIKNAPSREEKRRITENELRRFSSEKSNQQRVQSYLAQLVPQSTIDREIYKLRRSTDITALPDIISKCFIPLAKKNLADAKREQKEAERATAIISSYRDGMYSRSTDMEYTRDRYIRHEDPLPEPPRRMVSTPPTPVPPAPAEPGRPSENMVVSDAPLINIHDNPVYDDSRPDQSDSRDRIDVRNGVPVVETTRDFRGSVDVTPDRGVTEVSSEYRGMNPSAGVVSEENSEYNNVSIMPNRSSTVVNNDHGEVSVAPDELSTVISSNYQGDFVTTSTDDQIITTDDAQFQVRPDVTTAQSTVTSVAPQITPDPVQEVKTEDTFGGIDFDTTASTGKVFTDDDVFARMKEVMPDLFDQDRTPIVDDEYDDIDDILNKFD